MSQYHAQSIKIQERARVRARAVLIVALFAVLALVVSYFLLFQSDMRVPPPPNQILTEEDKLDILEELSATSQNQPSLIDRQKILEKLVGDSPKKK